MMSDEDLGGNLPDVSIPKDAQLVVRGCPNTDLAQRLGKTVISYVAEISRVIDCSTLDGITLAFDYEVALQELDRGHDGQKVSPTRDIAIGIAMTPGVLRAGQHKSHIVFNADYFEAVLDDGHELWPWVIHLIAHECGHVMVTAAYDRCFPGVLLQTSDTNLRSLLRKDAILACWDEYAVTWLTANFGRDPLPDYGRTLVQVLSKTKQRASDHIREYRGHGDVGDLVRQLFFTYASLLKYASYYAGTMVRQGCDLQALPEVGDAVLGSWFEPFFDRLLAVMSVIHGRMGTWESEAEFDPIADIVEDMILSSGVYLRPYGDGYYAEVHWLAGLDPS